MVSVKLKPAFKDYLWGGHNLIDDYRKDFKGDVLAESWEVSCHEDGPSVVSSGPHVGLTLAEYINIKGKDILGHKGLSYEDFPLLIKFIDAKQDLSIQVHPNNEYALHHENQYGKTEMWYVMGAQQGASIYYGTNRDVTLSEFKEAIESNTILDLLNKVPVSKGDAILVEAGTIHAIGAGVMICEVQQNSNVTYRVYDFDRVGTDGKKRDLHIEKSLDVSNLKPLESSFKNHAILEDNISVTRKQLIKHEMFDVQIIELDGDMTINIDDSSFVAFVCLEGDFLICDEESIEIKKGDSVFSEAGLRIISCSGKSSFLKISL